MVVMLMIGFSLHSLSGSAQTDTTKDPKENEQQDQLYWKELPKDLPPFQEMILMSKDTIPTRLRKTLQDNPLYSGWEGAPLYFDKNTDLYMLYMKNEKAITVYGFSEKGKAITYNSYSKPADR